jgi:hypothetical protein
MIANRVSETREQWRSPAETWGSWAKRHFARKDLAPSKALAIAPECTKPSSARIIVGNWGESAQTAGCFGSVVALLLLSYTTRGLLDS